MNVYVIKKALNNNIVLCSDEKNENEFIVLGKGIGFNKKPNETVEEDKVEKIYFNKNTEHINQYQKLLPKCSDEIITVVEEVIDMIEKKFNTDYDEYIHIALLDHLNFSVYRYENNINISNIFLEEISVMYDKIYDFSKTLLTYINKRLNVNLPETEIAFITLHIHSALNKQSSQKSVAYAQIINQSINYIEQELNFKIKDKSIEKIRLITHLKFALKRAEEKIQISDEVIGVLSQKYPVAHNIAKGIAKIVNDNYKIKIEKGEVSYLTIHIQNIINSVQ